MSKRRTAYGAHRYEVRVNIQGQNILLGYFQYRSDACKAEEVAAKIRDALNRAALIKRKELVSTNYEV